MVNRHNGYRDVVCTWKKGSMERAQAIGMCCEGSGDLGKSLHIDSVQ